MHPGKIVVGVDGSAPARQAIRWAVAQARATAGSLHLLHVWHEPLSWADHPTTDMPAMGPLMREPFDPELEQSGRAGAVHDKLAGLEAAAAGEVEQALLQAVGSVPADVRLTIDAVEGDARDVLVEASASADLLVVGSHRSRAIAATVLGSISHHCALHAHCPVVIIPADVELSANGALERPGGGADAPR